MAAHVRFIGCVIAVSIAVLPVRAAAFAPEPETTAEPATTVEAKPVEAKPVEAKTVDPKTVDPKTVDPKTVEAKPVEAETNPAVPSEPVDPGLHDPMFEARRAYDRGRALYDGAQYEAALGSFLDAQRLYASPDHHFNIARCYEALGRYELAIEYYSAYLRASPKDEANIQNTIDRLERIVAAKPEPEPVAQPKPVAVEPAGKPERDRQSYPGKGMVITGGVVIGVGAALGIGGGIGLGMAARDRSTRVDAVFNGGNPDGLQLEQARALDEEGRRFEGLQIAAAVVGGAVAAGGAVLLVLGLRRKARAPQATALIGRGLVGLSLSRRF